MPSRSLAWQASQRDYGAIPLVEPVLRDQRSFRVLVGGNESGLAGALAFQVLIALARGKPFGWCDILGCEAPGIPPGSVGGTRPTPDDVGRSFVLGVNAAAQPRRISTQDIQRLITGG
jgi:hypothetical protein